MIEVVGLRVAPVKGLAAVPVDTVWLGRQGVPEDRRLFLLRKNGSVVTMRRFPSLSAVLTHLDLARGRLTVTFPDRTKVTSPLEGTGERAGAVLFGKRRSGAVVDGLVASALSTYVGETLRLVLADSPGIGWDEGPVSMLGEASVAAVGTPAGPDGPDIARFRMLVELAGSEPFEEDSWVGRRVLSGRSVLRVTHPLQRCMVVDHRSSTGDRDWDAIKALAAHRGPDQLTLGVIAEVEVPGHVGVGDRVRPV